MGARFLSRSWLRLKPLIDQKVIAEPIWFKVAQTFPPLPLPELNEKGDKQDIRELFPEEVERRKVDEKYQVEQMHVLWENEKGIVFGREELRKNISGFLGDEADEEVAWKVALLKLKRMQVKNVELDRKREKLLDLKKLRSL
ncbi:hypothetical protein LOD99_4653 [Oopsacas minuta]|uniref:Small ribosomal subunit protein mS23 conserved domain-containing protein n=1 Tax=Oopsacas minuta TaxID=111878 RepID=A0AAV7JT10_9METZ|nr:hypothetical protein LOD99_4653 [Oopsacas minuta]